MAGRPKGYPKSGGRKKGTPNRVTGDLKDMILESLMQAGGIEYLKTRAIETPGPYLALVGKVLPMQVSGSMSLRVVLDSADADL